MSEGIHGVFELAKTYAFLEDGGAAPRVDAQAFWKTVMGGGPPTGHVARVAANGGWLLAGYQLAEDNKGWELHPAGDEVLVMLSGHMGVVLEKDGKETTVEVPAGKACVVPRGTWHRQVVRSPGAYIGATYGQGTQHRPR